MPRNPSWTRDELILALDLYIKEGLLDNEHPKVIDLSQVLNKLGSLSPQPHLETFRNPNGIAMKLANFASLDPSYGGVALARVGHRDVEIWDEFSKDHDHLASEAAKIRQHISSLADTGHQRMQYWVFNARPTRYRIEEAVRDLEVDNWTTKGQPITKGDRVAIWKSHGRKGRKSSKRGVVALGEVTSDPYIRDDSSNPYWVDPSSGTTSEMRVEVRYVHPPGLPLWLEPSSPPIIERLTVSRGQDTVFNITPEQWQELVETAGGWPVEVPEIDDVQEAVTGYNRKRASGQGFRSKPEERRAIELYAMLRAEEYYRAQGWEVKNVSANASYDLHCTNEAGEELHVEVKGTRSEGTQVLLTRNEVQHARRYYPKVSLFVLANIELEVSDDGKAEPMAGKIMIIEPWSIAEAQLSALVYQFKLS